MLFARYKTQLIAFFSIALLNMLFLNCLSAQNSTRKTRTQPNVLAAKAGTYVQWNNDLDAALETSKSSGKPIFWYIPTLRGTFMDRKVEIDRYMMAGVFSWPEIINYLNEHFLCVKAEPNQQQQKQFELSRYKFVEPGFLVIADGKAVRRVDQITTQNNRWFGNLLFESYKEAVANDRTGDKQVMPPNVDAFSKTNGPVTKMFIAINQFKSGQHEAADRTWQQLIDAAPNHPLAAKAAAEIQRIGPFCRGLETFTNLPNKSLTAGIHSRGSRAPASTFNQKELWQRGVQFLLDMQNENGGFYDSDYDFGGSDSLPNVHVAITSLAAMALLQSLRFEWGEDQRRQIENALSRSVVFTNEPKNINRVDRDEILWADAYRLRLLCACAKTDPQNERKLLQAAVDSLQNIQSRRGSWYHEYENSFVTATALLALHEAQQAGATIDMDKIGKGVASLLNDRNSNGSFPYYSSKRKREDRTDEKAIHASAGRMPVCELALSRWGKSDQKRLQFAIEQSFKHHDKLAIALKYDNHTSTYAYGGFFFWYDMRSRTEAILGLENPQLREKFLKQQYELVMALPEIDGCFVDSHELGRCYGTAMALLCLAGCNQPQ